MLKSPPIKKLLQNFTDACDMARVKTIKLLKVELEAQFEEFWHEKGVFHPDWTPNAFRITLNHAGLLEKYHKVEEQGVGMRPVGKDGSPLDKLSEGWYKSSHAVTITDGTDKVLDELKKEFGIVQLFVTNYENRVVVQFFDEKGRRLP